MTASTTTAAWISAGSRGRCGGPSSPGKSAGGPVRQRMVQLRSIPRAQAARAVEAPVPLVEEGNAGLIGIRAPYFVSYILPYLLERYGEDFVYSGGLRVYTTLDLRLQ